MANILIVDDDEMILSAFTRVLRKYPWNITTVSSPIKALELCSQKQWNVLISDYKMPEMDGVKFLERAHGICPNALLMIMSANIDFDGLSEALNRANVHRFISKPWDDLILGRTINEAVVHQNLLAENTKLANMVRRQKRMLDQQKSELMRLESESPGITKVNWDEDGAIILDDSDY